MGRLEGAQQLRLGLSEGMTTGSVGAPRGGGAGCGAQVAAVWGTVGLLV